jgi:hypothetical protein
MIARGKIRKNYTYKSQEKERNKDPSWELSSTIKSQNFEKNIESKKKINWVLLLMALLAVVFAVSFLWRGEGGLPDESDSFSSTEKISDEIDNKTRLEGVRTDILSVFKRARDEKDVSICSEELNSIYADRCKISYALSLKESSICGEEFVDRLIYQYKSPFDDIVLVLGANDYCYISLGTTHNSTLCDHISKEHVKEICVLDSRFARGKER